MIHESNLVDPSSDHMLSDGVCTDNDRNQYVVYGLFTQQTESDKGRMEDKTLKVQGGFLVGSR